MLVHLSDEEDCVGAGSPSQRVEGSVLPAARPPQYPLVIPKRTSTFLFHLPRKREGLYSPALLKSG
jgi:hypothetical protein